MLEQNKVSIPPQISKTQKIPTITLTSQPIASTIIPTSNELAHSRITSTPKSVSQEDWRVPSIPNYINSIYDIDNEDWQLTDYIVQNTRAIEPPLRWEYYTVNSNFADISNYYLQIMKEKDFQVTQNCYDNETSKGFITFSSPTLIVYVQFINNFLIDGQDDVIVVYKKYVRGKKLLLLDNVFLNKNIFGTKKNRVLVTAGDRTYKILLHPTTNWRADFYIENTPILISGR